MDFVLKLTVKVVGFSVHALVIYFDFSLIGDVIVHDHFLAAYKSHAPYLAGIQPTGLSVGQDVAGKSHRYKHDILHTSVQIPATPCADRFGHGPQQEKQDGSIY